MRILLVCLIAITISLDLKAQTNLSTVERFLIDSVKRNGNNADCKYIGNQSLAKRLKIFPFNKAVKVEVISFTDRHIGATLPLLDSNLQVDYSKLKK